jgi:hypothetical protein
LSLGADLLCQFDNFQELLGAEDMDWRFGSGKGKDVFGSLELVV